MKSLKEEFKEEADCYNLCMKLMQRHLNRKNYGNAAVYLEDAGKSLNEMARIKQEMEDLKVGKVTFTGRYLGFENGDRFQ